jgi:hypothetical protein
MREADLREDRGPHGLDGGEGNGPTNETAPTSDRISGPGAPGFEASTLMSVSCGRDIAAAASLAPA